MAVFGNAGQDCCARSRILVERSALDRFMDALRGARRGDARRRPARRGHRDGPADLRRPARDRSRRFVPDDAPGGDPRQRARRPGLLVPADRAVPGRPRRPRGDRGDLRAGRRRRPVPRRGRGGRAGQRHDLRAVGLGLDARRREGAARRARASRPAILSINSNTSVRVATPFGGFKQSGLRPRARAARHRRLHRGQDDLHRDGG